MRILSLILLSVVALFLAACGQSNIENTGDLEGNQSSSTNAGENRNESESPQEENEERSCPSPSFEGQTAADLSEAELGLYSFKFLDDYKENDQEEQIEGYKTSVIQGTREKYFRERLSSYGVELQQISEIGRFAFNKGSLQVSFKEGLTPNQEEKKATILKAIEDVRKHFNEKAVFVNEVNYSQEELDKMQSKVSRAIEKRDSIKRLMSSVGSCFEGDFIEVGVKEELSEEDIAYLKEQVKVDVVTKVSLNALTGYVVRVKENEMLVNEIWFSNAPDEVEVGDHMKISFSNVMESYPGQSSAFKSKELENKKPEGADLRTSEAIQRAFENSPDANKLFQISEVAYKSDSDVWLVTAEGSTIGKVKMRVEDK